MIKLILIKMIIEISICKKINIKLYSACTPMKELVNNLFGKLGEKDIIEKYQQHRLNLKEKEL